MIQTAFFFFGAIYFCVSLFARCFSIVTMAEAHKQMRRAEKSLEYEIKQIIDKK